MKAEGIILIVVFGLTRMTGLVCGTILILNGQLWPGLAVCVVPFIAGAHYKSDDDAKKQNI